MATLVRWEPFREVAALQNDMGRLVSAFLGHNVAAFRARRDSGLYGRCIEESTGLRNRGRVQPRSSRLSCAAG